MELRESSSALAYIAVSSFAILFAGAAAAQSAGSTLQSVTEIRDRPASFDEIVVTARKREETLLDVPVAVTALGAGALERAAAVNLNKIATLAPQLVIVRADSGSGASFTLRGVGSPAYDSGIEQSVSVNVDGVQIGRGNIVSQGFFDLQQVEILKGPQALFFGKNSPAGVISLTSKGPTENFEAYVKGGYEFNANEWYTEGAVSGPVTDTLGIRLALRASQMDGWMHNAAPPAVNPFAPDFPLPGGPDGFGVKDYVGRLSVQFEPSSDFSMALKLMVGSYKDNGPKINQEAYCFPPATHPSNLGIPDTLSNCKVDFHNAHGNIPPGLVVDWPLSRNGESYTDQTSILSSLTTEYTTGDVTLTSVTGYYYLRSKRGDSADTTSLRSLGITIGEKAEAWSQELRLTTDFDGQLNLMVGAYYQDARLSDEDAVMFFFGGPDPDTGKYHTFERSGRVNGKTYSAFGQMRWDIMENLELAGGVRYTREKKTTFQKNDFLHPLTSPALSPLPLGDAISGRYKDSNWSPEVTLSWKPLHNILVYGAYKTGYKSGGFSNPGFLPSSATSDSLQVGAERAKGGELGFKADLLGRSLLLQGTAYLYDFKDLQVTSFDAPTNSFLIRNAATLRTKGVELSANWRATEELGLHTAASYNRAVYRSFPLGNCYPGQPSGPGGCMGRSATSPGIHDLSGQAPPRAPRWNILAGANYDRAVTDNLMVGISGDINYTSSFGTQENNNPLARQKGYTLVNSALRLYREDRHWELALLGRNLTNRKYIQISTEKVLGGLNEFQGTVQRAREIVIEGTLRF